MIKSHPDKQLVDHLLGVKDWGNYFLALCPCKILDSSCDEELWSSFFLLHDIGKITPYYQRYIDGQVVEQQLKSHAHLSAFIFLSYSIIQEKIEQYGQTVSCMFMCIYKHHANLSSLTECLENICGEKELLEKQWNSIKKQDLKELLEQIELNSTIATMDFQVLYEKVKEIQMKWRRQLRGKDIEIKENSEYDGLSFQYYLLTQNLYSLLLNSDKSEVGIGNKELVQNQNYEISVEKYLESKKKKITQINHMRQQALEEVQDKIDTVYRNSIYALTLPTGMGKTLNSINFSLKLKKKLEKESSNCYKIIYALPFMSIIDQTFQVLEEILEKNYLKVDTSMLLKSHHLAEMEWKTSEDTLEEVRVSKLLVEGWNSSIIVTTFIQLFETLIGYRNSTQRKFHQLNHSIIIIDEIQSLPIKYYKVIRKLLLEFTKYTDTKFIIMTATQPKILNPDEVVNLCESKKYYKSLERTNIINEISKKMTIEQFIEKFEYQEKKTYLMIVNTIQSSKMLYEKLKEKYPDKKVVLLNTNFPPIIRKQIIAQIKEKQYDIVVSTQLVEAGVDIDMNIVYRDLAPLPQLLQSAGRAGREGLSKGEVYIIHLITDMGKSYANYIYDSTDLDLTNQVLEGKQVISEKDFMDLINQYYDLISDPNRKSQDESIKLIKGLHLNKFSRRDESENCLRYAEDFRLIDNKETMVNVFIELDEKAQNLWKEYESYLADEKCDRWEKKARIENIQKKMAEYIVTVRLKKEMLKQNFPPLVNKYYYYVEKDMIENYYSEEYGFGKSEVIFI